MSFNVIPAAYAANGAAPHMSGSAGLLSMLPYFILIIVVVYFFILRPQKKRADDQKKLMDALRVGDEVVSIGGIVGKIVKLRDDFIVLSIDEKSQITLQKNAISMQLPQGSMERAQ